MPVQESHIDTFYTVTTMRNIHPRTFEVAESWELKTSLFGENFRRAVDGTYAYPTGVQLPLESRYPMLKHSSQVIMFKRALKRELKTKNIPFDHYRIGHMAAIDIDSLLDSCALHVDSIIDIHESDYNDYKSEILGKLSNYGRFHGCSRQQDRPHHYWITDADVDTFASYMENWFLPNLDQMDQTYPLHNDYIDTRLVLDDIFHHHYR